LNVWGGPDRFLAIADAAARRIQSEELVDQIADALATAGEYVTRIDLQPTQRVVDLNWAAHQAGRRLGIRIDVDTKIVKGASDGRAHAWSRSGRSCRSAQSVESPQRPTFANFLGSSATCVETKHRSCRQPDLLVINDRQSGLDETPNATGPP
jgi:hypothetical protein